MARSGSFIGPSEYYGAPLSIVHPQDNAFPRFDPDIEALSGVSDEKKAELQAQLDNLYGALVLGRDQE